MFAPNSYGRRVWSLAWMRLKVKVKVTMDKNGIFWPFRWSACGLCLVLWFMFGKISLVSIVEILLNVFVTFCRPTSEMMGFQPTHNGQYDGYHEMTFQQQGMHYPSHMQTCTSAGNTVVISIRSIMFCVYVQNFLRHSFHSNSTTH